MLDNDGYVSETNATNIVRYASAFFYTHAFPQMSKSLIVVRQHVWKCYDTMEEALP